MKMRNKKTMQFGDRQNVIGKRRSNLNLKRTFAGLSEKPYILIVCEGKNTEPSYFKHFRMSSAIVKSVGEGYNTISLVNRAVQLASQEKYDQVYQPPRYCYDKRTWSSGIVRGKWISRYYRNHRGRFTFRRVQIYGVDRNEPDQESRI